MGDTAVVQEALDTIHIATLAVVAHQLDEFAIARSPQDQRARLLLPWCRYRVIRDTRHRFARNVTNRFAGGFSGSPTVTSWSVGGVVSALGEARSTDRLGIELRVAQQPHPVVATVRTINHSVRSGVRGLGEARLRVDSRTSTSRYRLGRPLASGEWSKFASSQLLQSDLAFRKLLVDQAKFVVLQEDLHVELVFDSLLEGRLGLCGGGGLFHLCIFRCLLCCRVVASRAYSRVLAWSTSDIDILLFGSHVQIDGLGGWIVGSMRGSSGCGAWGSIGQRGRI